MTSVNSNLWMELPPRHWPASTVTQQQATLNAANEAVHYIGQVQLEGGSAGGTKTISSAGGKIHWLSGSSVTFVNAGSTLRVGLQDVSTAAGPPGRGDGTFDVQADLVGGTDVISTLTTYETPMESGTKTLSQGDTIAIVLDLVSRGGADSLTIRRWSNEADTTMGFPATVLDTGSPISQGGQPCAVIEFDDGTFGWIYLTRMRSSVSNIAYHVNSGTADEYGTYLNLEFPTRAIGVSATLNVASGGDFEVILYSDPLGVPVAEATLTVDATQLNGTTVGSTVFLFASEVDLPIGAYAVTFRPTTTNSVTLDVTNVDNVEHFKTFGGLTADKSYAVRRLDNTGAFSDYNGGTANTRRIHLSLIVDQFDDGAGGAAGGVGAFHQNNDTAVAWLRAQGFTGTYNDMLKQFLLTT